METPEQIERALRERLMPRGFSGRGSQAMDELIDQLAVESPPSRFRLARFWKGAAAVAILCGLSVYSGWQSASPEFNGRLAGLPEVKLLSETEGVVSAEVDDLLLSDSDGCLLQAWHVRVVNEEVFRDAETGYEVKVVHPRDEMVLVPVNSF